MNIKEIKDTYTCLDIIGSGKVVRKTPNAYLCRAPWRKDSNPSLSVTLDGKGWHDLATGDHGSVIDLMAHIIGTTDFGRICAEFSKAQPNSFSFSQSDSILLTEKREKNEYDTWEVAELHIPQLINYLAQRGIKESTAKMMGCKEAHYTRGESRYYAIAYPNDKGGYELRSAPYKANTRGFKGAKAPKGITTHLWRDNAPTVVFEGFMDMLSFIQSLGGVRHNYIVLNSTVCADAAIAYLQSHSSPKVFLCLDNDPAGDVATQQMLTALPTAIDIRHRFTPYNDVNAWLLAKHKNA